MHHFSDIQGLPITCTTGLPRGQYLTRAILHGTIVNTMVNNDTASLNEIFAILADPTRRAILIRLAEGPAHVSELAAPFAMSLPAISKHLRALEHAGLLTRQRDGRHQRCRLHAAPLKEVAAWIAPYQRFWEDQFDALDTFLKDTADGEHP
jgi:DNA-binding transcriptional ArsR family regulator